MSFRDLSVESRMSRTRSCTAWSTGVDSPSTAGLLVVSGIKWLLPRAFYLHPMVGDPGRGTEESGATFRERSKAGPVGAQPGGVSPKCSATNQESPMIRVASDGGFSTHRPPIHLAGRGASTV